MATWPADGETNWNTKMLAYLAISHTTTGYNKFDINGTGTKVLTKYFTGILDADAETSVAHGITGIDNILSLTVSCYHSSAAHYYSNAVHDTDSTDDTFSARYDGTNVIIAGVGSEFQGQKYKIRIDYVT